MGPAGVRRRRAPVAVPERLCRFVRSEWPGAGCEHEALRMWERACLDWLAADSARQPRPGAGADFNRSWLAGGSRRVLPFGSAIDVLREHMRYRRALGPCPSERLKLR